MEAKISKNVFRPKCGTGTTEYHCFVTPSGAGLPYADQMEAVTAAVRSLADEGITISFVRFFLSDASNQQASLAEAMSGSAFPISYIQQPPLDGTKLAAWVYGTCPGEGTMDGGFDPGSQVWDAYMTAGSEGSLSQMSDIFADYGESLAGRGLTVAQDCVRTWIFVHDVDVNYGGVVKGRRDYFGTIGLLPDTHFIASTGIEGRHADPKKLVVMDALAVRGLKPGQLQYLYAKDHLSPTADYGVTFERGTAVKYADRTHIYISGTASIDHKGDVLFVGDVRRQVDRMLENVSALLSEAGAGLSDIAMAVVYLRDTADYSAVREQIARRCPELNAVFVLAPVCRPTWLVEMECIAIV